MPISFKQSLKASTSEPKMMQLPLCHVDSFDKVTKQLESGELMSSEICDVFKEKLNYLFYGRATYRPKDRGAPNVLCTQPAALILRPGALPVPFSVYPFDTGGFSRYEPHSGGHQLEDFSLGQDLSDAERIIERHWRDPGAYARAELSKFISRMDANSTEVETYSNIVARVPYAQADSRRSSVEVTTRYAIPLNKDTIFGLVVPRYYADRQIIQDLKRDGVHVQPYSYQQENQDSYMSVVTQYAADIIELYHSRDL